MDGARLHVGDAYTLRADDVGDRIRVRHAVPCHAVPCRAMPCRAMPGTGCMRACLHVARCKYRKRYSAVAQLQRYAKRQVEFTSADGLTSESVVTAVIKAAKPSSIGRSTGSILYAQPEDPTPHTVDVLSAELSTTAPVEVCRASKPQLTSRTRSRTR